MESYVPYAFQHAVNLKMKRLTITDWAQNKNTTCDVKT